MSSAFLFCLAVFVVSLVAALIFKKTPQLVADPTRASSKRQEAKKVSFTDSLNVSERVKTVLDDSTNTGSVSGEINDSNSLVDPLNPLSPFNPLNPANPQNVFRDEDPTPAYESHPHHSSSGEHSNSSSDAGHSHSSSDSSNHSHSSSDYGSSHSSSSHSYDSGNSYGGDSYGGHHSSSSSDGGGGGGGFDGGSHGGHH